MEFNIEENKYRFIDLLRKVERPGADIGAFVYKLESSDFFVAPASTIYHLNVKGGLCQHSLNVYEMLVKLVNMYYPEGSPYTDEQLIIVALCHDMDKMNKYETYFKNVKKYCDNGSKRDDAGRFEWATESAYKTREASDRFVYGHHGQNSEYITAGYIPLSIEESAAIVNHSGGDDQYKPYDMTPILNKYPLAVFLHMADYMSTYLVENE